MAFTYNVGIIPTSIILLNRFATIPQICSNVYVRNLLVMPSVPVGALLQGRYFMIILTSLFVLPKFFFLKVFECLIYE